MAIKQMQLAGKWTVKNIDGEEKLFSDPHGPAADVWKKSRSSKKKQVEKAPKFSQEWWNLQSGLTPMNKIREGEIDAQLKKFLRGGATLEDFSFQRHGRVVKDGVVCAQVEVRCVMSYGKSDDLGLDEDAVDGVWLLATRDPQNPKTFSFSYTG